MAFPSASSSRTEVFSSGALSNPLPGRPCPRSCSFSSPSKNDYYNNKSSKSRSSISSSSNSGVASECSTIILTAAPAMRMGSLDSRQVSAGSGAPRQLSPKLDVPTGIGVGVGFGFGPVASSSNVRCLAAASTAAAAAAAAAATTKRSARENAALSLLDRSSPMSDLSPFKQRIPWTRRALPRPRCEFSDLHEKKQLWVAAMGGLERTTPILRHRGVTTMGGDGTMGWKCGLSVFSMVLAMPGPAAASAAASASWGASSSASVGVLKHDLLAGAVTMLGAVAYIELFNVMAKRDVLSKMLSRKLVHIGVGLIFMLFWPLYSASSVAPFIAAFAPGANCLRIVAVGLGLLPDENLVKSMTRQNNRKELLRGPLFYGFSVVVATSFFWRTSVIGVVILATMCAGDGIADIMGRRFGKKKLPYNKMKSVVGTLSFFIFSSAVSVIYLNYYAAFGFLDISEGTIGRVVLICFLSAVMESTPLSSTIDDNLLVPFTSAMLGMLLLPSQ